MTRSELLQTAKPILFNTYMVRSILYGLKTVTRAAVKPQPVFNNGLWMLGGAGWSENIPSVVPVPGHSLFNRMPYKPGDILFVHEKWYKAPQIFLSVKSVRMERLQNIDADGIRNEGLTIMAVLVGNMEIAQDEFALLWDTTINKSDLGRYGWAANPWVWVIEFKRLEVQE